jgi:hypothetical protein
LDEETRKIKEFERQQRRERSIKEAIRIRQWKQNAKVRRTIRRVQNDSQAAAAAAARKNGILGKFLIALCLLSITRN